MFQECQILSSLSNFATAVSSARYAFTLLSEDTKILHDLAQMSHLFLNSFNNLLTSSITALATLD